MSNSRNLADLDIGVGGLLPASNMATGAAVSNIGYTPVNNAGGTMTGALTATGFTGPLTGNASTATTTTGNAATATTATNQSGGTVSATSISDSGNLAFTGTGNRITGDFSNATFANRVMFQNSTVNSTTAVEVIPNGTATASRLFVNTSSDPANTSSLRMDADSTSQAGIFSDKRGTGTYLPMTFNTGGNERVRIDTSGNVGIGTTSPQQLLAVGNSTDQFGAGVSGAVTTAYFGVPSNSSGGIKRIAYDRSSGSLNFIGGTIASPATQMTLDTSGNVGIGTSSPSGAAGRALAINGGTDQTRIALKNSTTGDAAGDGFQIVLNAGATGVTLEQRENDFLAFGTNAIERMRIDASGNVGIGTTSPAGKLDVAGTFRIQANGDVYGASSNAGAVTLCGGGVYNAGGAIQLRGSAGGDYVSFYTGSFAERARIDSSGNVGIGTSSPTAKLHVTGTVTNSAMLLTNSTSGLNIGTISNYATWQGTGSSDDFVVAGYGARSLILGTNGAERARIDSGGRLLIAATSILNGVDTAPLQVSGGSVTPLALRGGTNGYQVAFYNAAGNSVIGSITGANGTTTAYNTASDYRLKDTIFPMTGALAKVLALKPCTYKWKVDGSDGQGFIAHELAEVEAGCVTGEKDAVDADGNPQYQGIDTSFLVATLTAAIQELKAIVDAQGAEIAALKSI